MPTVPVTFNYIINSGSTPTFSDSTGTFYANPGPYPFNGGGSDWQFFASWDDSKLLEANFGTTDYLRPGLTKNSFSNQAFDTPLCEESRHGFIQRIRYFNDSLSPVTFSSDIGALFPIDELRGYYFHITGPYDRSVGRYPGYDVFPAYGNSLNLFMTYPDEWHNARIGMAIHTRNDEGYVMSFVHGDIIGGITQKDYNPTESEDFPMTVGFRSVYGSSMPKGGALLSNLTTNGQTVNGEITVEWGDGEKHVVPFSVSLPGAIRGYRGNLTRIARLFLNIGSPNTGSPSLVVVTDDAQSYNVELRGVELPHSYLQEGNEPIRYWITTDWGRTDTHRAWALPVANFTSDEEGQIDATNSFDLVDEVVAYRWVTQIAGTGVQPLVPPYGSSINEYTSVTFPQTLEDGEYWVWLMVRSAQTSTLFTGRESAWRAKTVVIETGTIISAISDHDGVGYVAVKNGPNVDVLEMKNGSPSMRVLSTLVDHSSPALYQIPGDATLYLSGKDKNDGIYKTYFSRDFGVNFSFMANSPFDNTAFKTPSSCGLLESGHAQCAIKKGTDEIWFSYSRDGEEWSTPVLAFILSGVKGASIYQESPSQSDVIVIAATNADGTTLKASDALGKAGSWVDYEALNS